VSVKDHEHFRLKLVYKRKKKIQTNLRDTENMLQRYMVRCLAYSTKACKNMYHPYDSCVVIHSIILDSFIYFQTMTYVLNTFD